MLGSGRVPGRLFSQGQIPRTQLLASLTRKGASMVGGTVLSPTPKVLGKRAGFMPVLHSSSSYTIWYLVGAQ